MIADNLESGVYILKKIDSVDDLLPDHEPKKRKLSANNPEEEEEITQMKKRLFYEDNDSKFEFEDGNTINFDKKLLCWHAESIAIEKLCFGPISRNIVQITDFKYETFQLFLNCIMGFSELTRESAEEIFPIVCKYLMTKWIEKCAVVLEPFEMNEDICNLLNMAFFYQQPILCSVVKKYTLSEGSPYGLLENDRFSKLLSLDSFLEIIKWVTIDSSVLDAIVHWCDNFLKINKRSESIKELLHELGLINHFKIDLFESGYLIDQFIESSIGKDIFTPMEVCKYFINSKNSCQQKSKWIKKKKGESFIEEYYVSDLQLNSYNCNLSFKFHKIVTYVSPNLNLSCSIRKYYSNLEGNSNSKTGSCNSKDKLFNFSLSDWYNDIRYSGSSYVKFEIKYNFAQDCRILVTNIKPRFETGSCETPLFIDEFYFTNKIFHTSS